MPDVEENSIIFTQCRACLCLGPKMVNIFSSTKTLSSISFTIMECVPVYMCEEDTLPHTICQLCLEKLEHAFDFRTMCLNSDIKLRNSYDGEDLKEEGEIIFVETNSLDYSGIRLETAQTKEEDTTDAPYETENIFLIPDSEIFEEDNPDVVQECENEFLITDSEIFDKGATVSESENEFLISDSEICEPENELVIPDLEIQENNETEYNQKKIEQFKTKNIEVKFQINIKDEKDLKYDVVSEIYKNEETEHNENEIDQLTNTEEVKFKVNAPKRRRKVHPTTESQKRQRTSNPGSPKSRNFQCDYCNKSFRRAYDLLRHDYVHTGIRHYKKPGPAKLSPLMYTCETCNKTFKGARNFKHHQSIHTGERHYCTICGRGFIQIANLYSHIQTHSSERNFSCEFCGLTFKAANVLKIHRTIHLDIRRFECDQCDKKFRLKQGLINHRRTHTGERPFPCNVCGKFYSKPEHATRHSLSAHSEKHYKCKICGQAFLTYKSYEMHQITKHGGIIS